MVMDMTSDGEGTRRDFRHARRCGVFTGVWALLLTAAALQAEPLYTSSPRFRIPFQFDPQEMERIGAVEVQLHVSTSGGANWTTAESVAPDSARFTFDAPGNGEYWFAVRTVDRQGRSHPGGSLQPSLHVVVDDQRPTLTLSVSSVGPGEAEVVWQADDPHLDTSTLQLEYLDPVAGVWQPLTTSGSAVGVTRFAGPSRGPLLVRGSISDLAGNSTNAEAVGTVTSPATTPEAGRSNSTGLPDWRDPVADFQIPPGGSEIFSPASRSQAYLPTILPNMPHAPVPSYASASRSNGSGTAQPLMPQTLSGDSLPGSASGQGSMLPGSDSPGQSLPGTLQGGLPVSPGVGNNLFVAPAPSSVRRVNMRTFRIGYEVHDVGPSGVGSVELYITEDNGARWFHYGTDPDRQSPFEVVVPRDGQYGFAIRVRNGLGAVADPPQPGAAPDIAVVVDLTPPTVRLMPLHQETAGGAYQVQISWFIQDDRLADRPVSLSHATSLDGPWEPITGWIENHGRYIWSVNTLVPRSVYVRLEARDAAGNVASTVSDPPLLIDTSRPTARILDIESVGSPAGSR